MSVPVTEGIDAGAVWHCGDPMAEQRALAAGQATCDLSHRGIVEVRGPERLTWLHALSAQRMDALTPGEDVEAAILSPQGHLEHLLRGCDDGEAFRAHVEPGEAEPLVEWLSSMVFATRAEAVVATGEWAAVHVDGRTRIVPRPRLDDALGASRVGLWAHEALRIMAGHIRCGVDTDERTLPNEVDMPGTVMGKGCYRGQEAVAHVHNLGRPPRRLVRLLLDGTENHLPPVGADILHDGKPVGRMGTSSRHHEAGPVGLGLVKRGLPTDATLVVDGVPASQEAIVDPEVGLHFRAGIKGVPQEGRQSLM